MQSNLKERKSVKMSKYRWNTLKALMASVLIATCAYMTPGLVLSAAAQDEDGGDQTLSVPVARVLGEAYELSQVEPPQFQQAISSIDQLIAQRRDRMTPYELATAYEMRGSFKGGLTPPDYAGALRDFEAALAAGGMNEERQRQIRFIIAQLYYTQERYPEAARFLREYIDYATSIGKNVDANTYYLLAASYVAMQDFRNARRPMEQALQKHRASGDRPQESYYSLMNYVYSEIGAQSERGDLLVEMVNLWPGNGQYWAQLSASYSEAGREDDAAATLELAYKAGILEGEDRILSLVSYYSFLENPYRGALLMEREMAAGNVQRNKNNLERLAQMYTQAREQRRALVPLREAAAISPDGDLYYNLGLVLFGDEQWVPAEEAFLNALNRGGLDGRKTGNAWLLIGNARFFLDSESASQQRRAIEALRRAQNYSSSRRDATDWITYIRDVQRTVCNQCRVEILQTVERFTQDRRRCGTILDVVRRVGLTSTITQEQVDRCNLLLEATVNETSGDVTLADGTVERGPDCSRQRLANCPGVGLSAEAAPEAPAAPQSPAPEGELEAQGEPG